MMRRQLNLALLFIAVILGAAFFISISSVAHEPPKAPSCADIQHRVREQCIQMQENQWYDGGSVSYMREDRIKDFPRCDNLATDIFHFCNNPPEKD